MPVNKIRWYRNPIDLKAKRDCCGAKRNLGQLTESRSDVVSTASIWTSYAPQRDKLKPTGGRKWKKRKSGPGSVTINLRLFKHSKRKGYTVDCLWNHYIYIETSIPSYLTARPSNDVRVVANRNTTLEWWENCTPLELMKGWFLCGKILSDLQYSVEPPI